MRAALRDWHREFKRPPLSYEWTPVSSAHADLPPTEGMRRWQTEHPRWPSTTTVLRYFGAWSGALEDVGLPVRRRLFDASLEERVLAAQHLAAAGLSQTAIGEQIGVSRTAVSTYLRAGSCRGCGTVIVQSSSGLCRQCAHVRSSWTQEEIIEAIRRWTNEEGEPPTKDDWRPANDRWRKEAPRWPSATVVVWAFGRWNDALKSAGYAPRGRTWSAEQIVAALRGWALAHNGAPPAYGDWAKASPDRPGVTVVADRFGSWTKALLAAGLAPRHRRWTRESAVAAIKEWSRSHGGATPSARAHKDDGMPSYSVLKRMFGSWGAAMRAADLGPRQQRWNAEEIVGALRAHIAEHGRPPTEDDWTPAPPGRPSPHTVRSRIGSWARAVELASDRPGRSSVRRER